MDIANLFIRALDNRGDVYAPYSLEGDFLPGESQIIENAIRPHVPEKVDAGFNNWQISKFTDGYFYARRATWSSGIAARSAEEMAKEIAKYYAR